MTAPIAFPRYLTISLVIDMQFEIYKSIGEKLPQNFKNVYYYAGIKLFLSQACIMKISRKDNKDIYEFDGPDKWLIERIKKIIDSQDGLLMYTYGAELDNGNVHALCGDYTDSTDPNFRAGIGNLIRSASASGKEDYHIKTALSGITKVDSPEDVQRLDNEIERRKEKLRKMNLQKAG